jgi:hypothetical protein
MANKMQLINFDEVKDHPTFEKLSTYFLEKIAHSIDEKLGNGFEDLIV